MAYESLHNHTTSSDGTQSHLELLATAAQFEFSHIAFTDHDMLPNEATLQQLAAYNGPVQWSIGCEISSGWPKELGGGPGSMFHILGLFVDPRNNALLQHCRQAMEARVTRMEAIVRNLRALGLTISVDDCLKMSGGEAVGRPHIVRALLSHGENTAVIDDIRQQMQQAAQTDDALREKYNIMMAQPTEKHAYTLFLSNDSFIKDIYVDYQYWTDMDKSVQLIRQAGGVAILAHWPTVKKKLPIEEIKRFIAEDRFDGLEVASGFTGSGMSDDELLMQRTADELGCMQTIGIDAHHAEDFTHFVTEKPETAKMSISQTARLLQAIEEKYGKK